MQQAASLCELSSNGSTLPFKRLRWRRDMYKSVTKSYNTKRWARKTFLNVKSSARNGINDVASKKNSAAYHLPNLHDVIFGNTADDPRLVGIPRKVRYLGRVTTVDKLQKQKFRQLGRAEIYPMRKGVLSRKMTGKGASTIMVPANKSGLVCRTEKEKNRHIRSTCSSAGWQRPIFQLFTIVQSKEFYNPFSIV